MWSGKTDDLLSLVAAQSVFVTMKWCCVQASCLLLSSRWMCVCGTGYAGNGQICYGTVLKVRIWKLSAFENNVFYFLSLFSWCIQELFNLPDTSDFFTWTTVSLWQNHCDSQSISIIFQLDKTWVFIRGTNRNIEPITIFVYCLCVPGLWCVSAGSEPHRPGSVFSCCCSDVSRGQIFLDHEGKPAESHQVTAQCDF